MKSLTTGKPIKVILVFMLPLLIGQLVQLFYNIVDTRIVGQILGEQSLASVASTSSFSDLLVQFIFGITNGFALITASFFGAKDEKNLKKSVAGTIVLGIISVLLISVICLLFLNQILGFLKVDETLFAEAKSYIGIILIGFIATAMYNICSATLRAIGDSVTPLIFLICSAVLNIFLDYTLITYTHLGVAGAALATVISQLVSVLLCVVYIMKKYPQLIPSVEDYKVDKIILHKHLTTGLSMGFMSSLFNLGTVCLATQINSLGSEIIVSHTASRKIFSLMGTPTYVLSMAQASFSAQNMGAKKPERIREGIRDTLLVCAGWSVLCIIAMRMIADVLVKQVIGMNNPEIIATSERYLRFASCFLIVCSAVVVLRNAMQGFGDSVTPIISSTIELIVKVLIAFFLVPVIGYDGVIVCEPIAWSVMVVPLIVNILKSPVYKKSSLPHIGDEHRDK